MKKRLPKPDKTWTDDDEGRTIFPDVIVHVRDEPFENLLVVEAKRNHTGKKLPPKDQEKLTLFTDPHGDFQYRWGAFVNFITAAKKKHAVVIWFSSDGKETGKKDVIPLSDQNGGLG